jgi:putative ABC transport system substrate-binding protein
LWLLPVVGLIAGCEGRGSATQYTVGIVCLNDKLFPVVQGFKDRLTELGYVEGKNISYLYHCPLKDKSQTKSAINSLVEQEVDLLFTMSTPITKQALSMAENKGIPIVFTPVYNVVDGGIVKDLLHHEKNLTGVQVGGSTPKALEWLLTIAPEVKDVLVPINEADPAARFSLKDLKEASEKLSVRLLIAKVRDAEELSAVLADPPGEMDAIWLLQGNHLVPYVSLYAASAIQHKVPLASSTAQYKQGAMISYGQRYERTGRQAGRLAHRVLQGVSPKDLPIETADFFLGLNLKTARAAGVLISDDVLIQAEDIIR